VIFTAYIWRILKPPSDFYGIYLQHDEPHQWGISLNSTNYGLSISAPTHAINVSSGHVTFAGNCTGPDFIATSDIRLKNVTGGVINALATVNKLNAIRFTWKDPDNGDRDREHIGFSAQEVLEVVPEVVYKDDEEHYGIAYDKLVPVLVEAIKELTAEVEALKKKVGD
jgi:hypothetical protein